MRNHISHILSGFFSSKTLLLGVLIFAVLFLPLHVQADPISDALGWAIKNAVNPVLNLIFGFFATIFEGIFKIVAGFLMLVINYFVGLNVVPDPSLNTPQFVIQGWNISRQFINILFILILAFIGLATILRLQTYQLQKTLPGLIIIALLVNFSGVFVGFIVDIGNIITKVFLDKIHGGWDFTGINFTASFTAQIARLIFYPIATLIFFIVMLLFVVRTMILWVLVILAPLAFGAYILPATKKYWTQWLQQLIQWSIIGIPISFFMYFAKIALDMGAVGDATSIGTQLAGFIAPFTALFLLFIGIMLSMQMAPAGAQGVINVGKKLGVKGALAAGSATWRKIGRGIEEKGIGWRKGGEQAAALQAQLKAQGAGFLQRARAGGYGTGLIARWTGRGTEIGAGELTRRMKARDERKAEEAERGMLNKDSRDLARIFNRETAKGVLRDESQMIAAIRAMIKNGDSDDLQEYIVDGTIGKKHVGETLKLAGERLGPPGYRPIAKALSGFIYEDPAQIGLSTDSNAKIFGNMTLAGLRREIPEKLSSGEITQGILGNFIKRIDDPQWRKYGEPLMQNLIRQRGADLLGATFRKPESPEGRRVMGAVVQNYINSKTPQQLVDENLEGLPRFFFSQTAAGAGIVGGYTNPETGRTYKNVGEIMAELQPFIERRNRRAAGAMPLRTTREINAEIVERSDHIKDMEGQIGSLEATKRRNVGTPNEWRNRERDQEINRLIEQENRLTSEIDELTDELGRIPKERDMLRDITNNRFAAMPPGSAKTRAEVEQEVRTEYEQKYRGHIITQVREEGPFIQWFADNSYGGNRNQAERERIRQLYDKLRLRDILPQLTPTPSSAETTVFEDIARGSAPLPPTTDKQRERKLTGSLQESLNFVQQIETEVDRLSREIQERTTKRQDTAAQEGMRTRWQSQLNAAKTRMDEIRRDLNLTP